MTRMASTTATICCCLLLDVAQQKEQPLFEWPPPPTTTTSVSLSPGGLQRASLERQISIVSCPLLRFLSFLRLHHPHLTFKT